MAKNKTLIEKYNVQLDFFTDNSRLAETFIEFLDNLAAGTFDKYDLEVQVTGD